MNVRALINLLCSDYASPSHNTNGSNNDDAEGSKNDDAVGEVDESVLSLLLILIGMMIAQQMWRTLTMTLLMIASVLLLFLLLTLISATKVNPVMMARLVIVVVEIVWATMRTCL